MNKQKAMIFAALFASLTAAVSFFKIPLPFTPVPVTLQTLMVLLSGAMLGSSYGALAMIVYLILGIIGLPVFSGGTSGFGVIAGPTGGYLLSYPFAAFVIGWIIQTKKVKGFLKYVPFLIILSFILIVFMDTAFNLGVIKLWGNAEMTRNILITISFVVMSLLLYLIYYAKKTKKFSLDMILAMFAGTLIIYIGGVIGAMRVTGLGLSAIFAGWVLPFIIGDTIKLLLAAWIAGSVDIKRYLK